MFLLWMLLTAVALDPTTPHATASASAAEVPQSGEAASPEIVQEAPNVRATLERALATELTPGLPWTPALNTTIAALGEPTSQHGNMRCWLFERTETSCSYWHLTSGTTADLGPGGDATPVVRFVGAGRASG